MSEKIPFSKFWPTGREFQYLQQVLESGWVVGDGPFTKKCHQWLEAQLKSQKALLTHSGTAALEMAAQLIECGPGDEIIMPSFTFVSTANAFVLRGATPIFVDIDPLTLNLDPLRVAQALTPRTKAIVPIHYAGISAPLTPLMELCGSRAGLHLIEDAAHAVLSTYKGRALGTWGTLGALSFHGTKNLVGGEAGALLIQDEELAHRAEILREKGTNRAAFFRGEVDKYTWVEMGSSYLPSELIAAVLFAQFEAADKIQAQRMKIWNRYHELFKKASEAGVLARPTIPAESAHNAHIYFVLLKDLATRTQALERLKSLQVQATFHYVPLHSSPMGKKVGRVSGSLAHTDQAAETVLRLPLYPGLSEEKIHQIAETVLEVAQR